MPQGKGTDKIPGPKRGPGPQLDTSPLEKLLNESEIGAGQLSTYSNDLRENMPGYESAAINNITGTAKSSLANDIYNVNTSANSRGLLNSGLRAGNQATAAAMEGSKLGSEIQQVNTKGSSQIDTAQQNATNAQNSVDSEKTQLAGLNATNQQSAYQSALQELQNQNQYIFDDLLD